MKILWSWLQDYLKENTVSVYDAASALTLSGTETTISQANKWASNFHVVLIKTVMPHPSADHLSICCVQDHNHQEFTVVCGAQNVRSGLKSILAKPGSILPGQKIPLAISTLRGIVSEGMLCSAEELCIEDLWPPVQKGIMEIPDPIVIGTTLEDLLEKDWLLDLEITPNRGDLLSHLGVARELSALGVGIFCQPKFNQNFLLKDNICTEAANVLTSACEEIYFCTLADIHQCTTPALIRRRLACIEQSIHFACVDITNYFCHDIGRPMHAFDADAVHGPIIVRESSEGEILEGLDDKTYSLPAGLVVVADNQGVLSLAGIMGGKRGACKQTTTHVILESAGFDPKYIARAGQALNIKSESCFRFERGIDPALVKPGLIHAIEWVQKHCGGRITNYAMKENNNKSIKPLFNLEKIKSLTKTLGGVDLDIKEITKRLTNLGCMVENDVFSAPSWRNDWIYPADSVKEALRLNGYRDIKAEPLLGKFKLLREQKDTNGILAPLDYTSLRNSRCFLGNEGLYEVVTWSFLSSDQAKCFWDRDQDLLNRLKLRNPISKDLSFMRPSLIPNLISIYTYHKNQMTNFSPIFEVGPCFFGPEISDQEQTVSALFSATKESDWQNVAKETTFYDIKGVIERLMRALGAANWHIDSGGGPSWYHPGRCARLWQGNIEIGALGQLHPRMKSNVWIFELSLSRMTFSDISPKYVVPSLQPVMKDLSFFIKDDTKIGIFMDAIKEAGKPELIDLKLIDLFQEGANRSVTLRASFQPTDHSFSDAQLHDLMDRLIRCAKANRADLRGLWE